MITLESITKKLGFNPLTYSVSGDHEDDSQISPFLDLTIEELDFIHDLALKTPEAWLTRDKDD